MTASGCYAGVKTPSSSNKEPSTKVASSLGESAPLIKTLVLLLNTANLKITYAPQNDKAMNDA